MEERLLEFLKSSKKPVHVDELIERMGVTSVSEQKEVLKALNNAIKNYSIIQSSKGNLQLLERTSFRKGKFYGNRRGEGKVVVHYNYLDDDGEMVYQNESYFVKQKDVNDAVDGDLVLVNLYKEHKNSPFMAQVTNVINRKMDTVIGEVYKAGTKYYVKPVDKKKQNITIGLDGEQIEGMKVAVSLGKTDTPNYYKGHIIRKFSHRDDPDEDILWEAFKLGVNSEFSNDTLEQVKHIPNKVLDTDFIGRVDLRDKEIFTIDGKDTKDIDDALSLELLPNGNYLVGVHIADVSHYVPYNSPLDKDAYLRGTSYYLAGRVIPMLPRELSNGICSLNPNVDRLAVSCMMEVDKKGKVVDYNIFRSVINSRKQMNYDEVNNILYDREYDPSYEEFVPTLVRLNTLARKLRENRFNSGAIDFDSSEIKLKYNDLGKVESVGVRYCDLGENLIEEFMLLANETVDKHIVKDMPCLHRVHGLPDEDKMRDFFKLMEVLGLEYDNYDFYECSNDNEAVQDLSKFISETGKISKVLTSNMIRCMAKAKYSANNIGHFGLAKDNYCHFTSPIRRYPDLTIHRLLTDKDNRKKIINNLDDIGIQSSKMERVAIDAENETLRMKCAEYMQNFVGEEFTGMVTSVSENGMNVLLNNYIEGRVRYRDLDGDYKFDEETFSLKNNNDDTYYQIGDSLKLRLIRASKEEKCIDMSIVKKLTDVDKVMIKK